MDAPSLTPERSRELADLRRRAYGPDADIHAVWPQRLQSSTRVRSFVDFVAEAFARRAPAAG